MNIVGIDKIKKHYSLRDSQISEGGTVDHILNMVPSRIQMNPKKKIIQTFNVIFNNGGVKMNVVKASTAILTNSEYTEQTTGNTLKSVLDKLQGVKYVVLVIDEGHAATKEAIVYSANKIKTIANEIGYH